MKDIHLYLNDFATRSFRDTADQDYIAARSAYRNELDQSFLWSALQAIEKYLKAILLFNGRCSKDLGHNLEQALNRVCTIDLLEFSVPDDVRDFLCYLDRYGQDRYLSQPTVLRRDALLRLDKSVWQIRRYCCDIRGERTRHDGSVVQRSESELQYINDPLWETHPEKFRIPNGFLEKVISKRLQSYPTLIWKNFYYGRRRKRTIKHFRARSRSINPTHTLHPEVFAELEKLVRFPQSVRKFYQERNAAESRRSTGTGAKQPIEKKDD